MLVHFLIPAGIILLVAYGAIIDKTDNRRPFGPKMCVNLCESLGHCDYPLFVTAQLDCYLGNVTGTSGVMLSTATHNRTNQYSRIILTRASKYITVYGKRQADRNDSQSLTCTDLTGISRRESWNTQITCNTGTTSPSPKSETETQVTTQGETVSLPDQRSKQSRPADDSMTTKGKLLSGINGLSSDFERWNYGNDVLYLSVSTVKKPWDDAQKICMDEEGSLVKLDSKQKQFAFNKMLKQYSYEEDLWIGLRLREKEWCWADGSKARYTQWVNSLSLISRKKNHRCASTATKRYSFSIPWYKANCKNSKLFVCERKKP